MPDPALRLVSAAPDEVSPNAASAAPRGEPPRIRFVALRVSRAPSGRGRVEVELEAVDGRLVCGAAEVQPIAEGDLRAAAGATVDALHQADAGRPRFAVLGVKDVRAFDQHVLLVQLGSDMAGVAGKPPARLMGSAFADADLMRATVLAVLNASNRVLWGPGGG